MSGSTRDRLGTSWITQSLQPGRRLHRIWWHFSDHGQTHLWRPMCWIRGYHVPHHTDVHFENCVYCWKPLWSRGRNGGTNPYRRIGGGLDVVDRAALTRRGRLAFHKRRALADFDARTVARVQSTLASLDGTAKGRVSALSSLSGGEIDELGGISEEDSEQ